MTKQTFTALGDSHGNLEFSDPERLKHYVINHPGPLIIQIGRNQRRRSEKQNRYFYGLVLQTLADHTGYTYEEIKQALKKEFGLVKIIEINGKPVEVLKSSAELSTSEFEEFMSKIRMLANSLGVQIPEPNAPLFIDN